MNKLLAIIQIIAAVLLSVAALAMLINIIFIATRPETISVVNAMIGGGVLVVCLPVLARVLFKKGLAGLRGEQASTDSDSRA